MIFKLIEGERIKAQDLYRERRSYYLIRNHSTLTWISGVIFVAFLDTAF